MTLGSALGFLLPPMIIKEHVNPEDIGADMNIFCWIIAVASALIALTVVFCKYQLYQVFTPVVNVRYY